MKMCFNRKVLAGLGVVAVGFFIFAPQLALSALPLLLLAACPLSMIFMMGGMKRMGGSQCETTPGQVSQSEPVGATRTREEQLAALKTQLDGVQAQQATIAHEIARMEGADAPVVREAEAVAQAADASTERRR